MEGIFADVEYFGLIYGDAELRGGIWYFRNGQGRSQFFEQSQINLISTPALTRQRVGSENRCPIRVSSESTEPSQ